MAQLDGVIPLDCRVLVLADRGLYAPWLYRQIVAQGWHPFLRINLGAKACVQGSDRWEWISHWLPAYGEQWVIVTDLPPQQIHGAWYRLRAWIEGGFKDYKRGQWDWHHTKMLDPARTAVCARVSLARGGMATGGLLAGRVASAVSKSPSIA